MAVLTIVSQATTISLEQKGLEKATARRLLEAIGLRAECQSGVWMPDAVFWAEGVNLKQHLKQHFKHRIRKAGD